MTETTDILRQSYHVTTIFPCLSLDAVCCIGRRFFEKSEQVSRHERVFVIFRGFLNSKESQNKLLLLSQLEEISFSFALTGLTKRPLPLVETHFDPTAVRNLGRHCSKRMPHDMFADCNLSPLYPAHSFTAILLLFREPTQHEVSREDSVTK